MTIYAAEAQFIVELFLLQDVKMVFKYDFISTEFYTEDSWQTRQPEFSFLEMGFFGTPHKYKGDGF